MFPLEFRGEVNREETRVTGMWSKLHILTSTVFWLIHPCGRQTDGRTDDSIARYSIMLSRAKDLKEKCHNTPTRGIQDIMLYINSLTSDAGATYQLLIRQQS